MAFEAGFQTLLGTYLQMATGWFGFANFTRTFTKGYMIDGGMYFIRFFFKKETIMVTEMIQYNSFIRKCLFLDT